MPRRPLAEPRDDRPLSELAMSTLVDSGCPTADAAWLSAALMDPRVLPPEHATTNDGDLSFTARCRLEHFGRQFKAAPDRNVAVLLGFDRLGVADRDLVRMPNQGPWVFFEPEANAFLSLCRNNGIDFTRALVASGHQSRYLPKLVAELLPSGGIDIARAIDWSKVLELSKQPGWWPTSHGSAQAADEDRDPSTLVFWLAMAGPAALDAVIPRVEQARREGAESLVSAARAIGWSIGAWTMRPREGGSIHPTWYQDLGPEFALRARRIFDILDGVVGTAPIEHGIPLREVWLRYAWMTFDRQADSMPEHLRARLYSAAADEIGRLRPLFRRAGDPAAAAEFRNISDFYNSCVHLVLDLGTLWQGLKPLLLAFCSLRAQAVATDLRFWHDAERDGKEPPAWLAWSIIPTNIVAGVHNYAGREQDKGDRDLEVARNEFAAWCLERLKTRKRRPKAGEPRPAPEGYAPELIEPDANWRECLIRAARELRVNPGGTGHQILHHVCQNDPDDQVKEAARIAYAETRAGWGSAKRISPRTLLLRAFAWIRQGHLLSLGIDPDPVGVQRTRDEERRRTTEPDPETGV